MYILRRLPLSIQCLTFVVTITPSSPRLTSLTCKGRPLTYGSMTKNPVARTSTSGSTRTFTTERAHAVFSLLTCTRSQISLQKWQETPPTSGMKRFAWQGWQVTLFPRLRLYHPSRHGWHVHCSSWTYSNPAGQPPNSQLRPKKGSWHKQLPLPCRSFWARAMSSSWHVPRVEHTLPKLLKWQVQLPEAQICQCLCIRWPILRGGEISQKGSKFNEHHK